MIPGLAANECLVWKKRLVSTEMQKGDNFVRSLFEAEDALMLFKKLYIVAGLYNKRRFIMLAMHQSQGYGYYDVQVCC